MQLQTDSAVQTQQIAEILGQSAFRNSLVVLDGDLGVGKTTFTKGFAKGLGIASVIKSPTYTLIREYHQGRIPLFHMDMYRIEETGGASELGLEEYLMADGVVVMEWAQFVEEELPTERLVISMTRTELADGRQLSLTAYGSEYQQWLDTFMEKWGK